MKKRNDLKVVFKTYEQQQIILLPPRLNELGPVNYPVRVVNKVLDQVDIQPLIDQYKPGGTSSYNPRMLLKVIVFAYINHTYKLHYNKENDCYYRPMGQAMTNIGTSVKTTSTGYWQTIINYS